VSSKTEKNNSSIKLKSDNKLEEEEEGKKPKQFRN